MHCIDGVGAAGSASGGDVNTNGGGAPGVICNGIAGGGSGGLAQKTYTSGQLQAGTQVTVSVGKNGNGTDNSGGAFGPVTPAQDGSVSITWTGTQASVADKNANLANALTALESALQALLAQFGR